MRSRLNSYLFRESENSPLVVFRIIFGTIMFLGTVRFLIKGWVSTLYLEPTFHFTYYGFDWVRPLPATGMYLLFVLMAIAALGIASGALYRLSAVLFFLSFTYIELLDRTYYLNHYYLVSLLAFLLIWLPAHKRFSVDAAIGLVNTTSITPAWTIDILRFQIAIVYIFAGIAKMNSDWLIDAMPLKVWLQAFDWWPVIGSVISHDMTAYIFSWAGMIYDTLIVFFLIWPFTRRWAYLAVVVFHLITALLFPIGVFPWAMIFLTWIFFSDAFHSSVLKRLGDSYIPSFPLSAKARSLKVIPVLLIFWVSVQILIPLRYLMYPGELFWTEEGYRFSWRVMLMEKTGTCSFVVKYAEGTEVKYEEIDNRNYLTPLQDRMMSTQPDMILQFAHFLKEEWKEKNNIQVFADCRVSLQGRRNAPLIDSTVDLASRPQGFVHYDWILPRE